jgi:multidrug transporter EmrE-like cation transporter
MITLPRCRRCCDRATSLQEDLADDARPASYRRCAGGCGIPTFYLISTLWRRDALDSILSRVPLSIAYPWIGVGVILVPMLAYLVYGERVNAMYWVGAVFVAVGIVLTQYGTPVP